MSQPPPRFAHPVYFRSRHVIERPIFTFDCIPTLRNAGILLVKGRSSYTKSSRILADEAYHPINKTLIYLGTIGVAV